jgi:hypothetical protein
MLLDTAERRTQRPDGEQRELRIRCSVSSGYGTNQEQLAGHGFTGTRDAEDRKIGITRAAGSDVERGPFVDALDLGAMSVRL